MSKIVAAVLILLVCEISIAQGWTALGSGMNDNVGVIVEHNGALYAAGAFTMAGGVAANYIAKWNGSSWSALGTGVNAHVLALASYNTELYAAGEFTMADGNTVNYIAKWNGTAWSAVGSGTNDLILSLGVYNGELYVGGWFTTAGGVSANHVAKWNGTSWSAVGTGTNSTIRAFAVYNAELYAGGAFTIAGGNVVNYIAKWNGTSWSGVGSTGLNNVADVFTEYNADLYVGGLFTTADGNNVNHIAKWNGSTWSAVGDGTDNQVRGLAVIDPDLYVSGWFLTAGGAPANYVAKWDDTSWSTLGAGMNSFVNCLCVFNDHVYAGGNFTMADGNTVNYISKWLDGCTSAPSQPGNITGNNSVCQGSSQIYSISPVGGATSYTWTLPTGWTGSSSTTSITATVGANGGTISVTADNSCGSSPPQTLAVTVHTVPPQPGIITGTSTVCQGSSQTYSISPVGGATSYTWTLPAGWAGSSSTTSITATVGANSGSVSVTANNDCGSSTAQTLAVTVNHAPSQPDPISGNNSVCMGSTQMYSIDAVNGATSYTWTLPAGWTGSSNTTSITATVGSNGGNISVTADNTCGSSPVQIMAVTVHSIPAQPGAITGNNEVCQGSSQTYSISAVNGATSYTWTLPTGWTGSSSTTSIITTVGASSGTISVTANNNCGNSTSQILEVVVNLVPIQPGAITGNNAVCQGSTQTYSINAVNGATSYTWTLPSGGGWSGSSTTTSITAIVGNNSGNISVTANNNCGSSMVQSLAVTVSSIPAQPGPIFGNNAVCEGSTQIYFINIVGGATSYSWTLPSGWTGNSSADSIMVTAGLNGGDIAVIANNECGSGLQQVLSVAVNHVPAQPGAISGNNTVCHGSSQTYSINEVGGATSYTWTLPAGWTGSSTTTSITTTAGDSSGTIFVTADNSCGGSIAQTMAVAVHSAPVQPDTINGNTFVCPGTAQTYTIIPIGGTESYAWTLPAGWSGNSTDTSILVTAGATGGDISVMAINNCGNSDIETLVVTVVNAVPSEPGPISGTQEICEGSAQIYSIDEVSGASSYSWTLPTGWTGSSTTTSINTIVGETEGTISVTADNGCGSSPAQSLAVTVDTVPDQPGAMSGNTAVNVGQVIDYSIDEVPGATGYNWSLSGGGSITSGQNTTSVSVDWEMAGNDTLSVNAINDCGPSQNQTLNIEVSIASGIKDAADPFGIKVMPNPFQDEVYLTAKGVMNKVINVEIVNLSGQIIYRSQQRAGGNDFAQIMNLRDIAAGLYQMRMIMDNRVFVKSLAKLN